LLVASVEIAQAGEPIGRLRNGEEVVPYLIVGSVPVDEKALFVRKDRKAGANITVAKAVGTAHPTVVTMRL
jgi:hypothetical protein